MVDKSKRVRLARAFMWEALRMLVAPVPAARPWRDRLAYPVAAARYLARAMARRA